VDLRKVPEVLDDFLVQVKSALVSKRRHKPTTLRSERRVRKSKEAILSTCDIEPVVEDAFKSGIKYAIIRHLRIVPYLLAVFVTKLNTKEVIYMFRILSKYSVLRFGIWAVKVDPCWRHHRSIDIGNVARIRIF
jgi:hypothetical protein